MADQILVVDDDPGIRRVVQLALEDDGYTVLTAQNGLEALQALSDGRPDVLLLDLQMPVMDGWQLQALLRERGSTIPVVFMSAGQRVRLEAQRCHADGYLAKPFDIDDLLGAVAHFLARPSTS